MEANLIVYDLGSTYTKAAAFCLEGGKLDFLGKGQALTTLEDIRIGAGCAENDLLSQGIRLREGTKRYSSCSAAGGLRMVALGYMPRVTAKAAKEVAMTAGARVMQVISADEPLDYRREALIEIHPDIILLSGGTDGGDEKCALENARMIAALKTEATVIVACNKYIQKEIGRILSESGIAFIRVPNIMPTIHELNVAPAREAIHEQFIKQITKASRLTEFSVTLADPTVIPTPGAVMLAGELLARGTYEQEGTGSVLLVDIGGATTDIHSMLPEVEKRKIEEIGLVINNEKQFAYRTVEGNLGLRVSATGILEAVGAVKILNEIPAELSLTAERLTDFIDRLEEDPNYLCNTKTEKAIEKALAICAVKIALRRHAGHYAKVEDPVMGIMAGTAMGRDLRHIGRVICIGGMFVHSEEESGKDILRRSLLDPGISLLPLSPPEIVIDKEYIFYAAGVLGKHYPEEVFSFLASYVGEKIADEGQNGDIRETTKASEVEE